jgi:hypothetical protein
MRKNKVWIFVLISIGVITYSIVNYYNRKQALGDSVQIVATIKNITYTRASYEIKVQYNYQGKTINNSFSTYNVDSLNRNQKIILSISREFPDKYIKYVGVQK